MDITSLLSHPDGSVFRWFAKQGSEIRGGFCETAYGLERIRLNHLDWNLYIGLNPTHQRAHLKVSDRDITHLQFILLDVDPVAEDADPLGAAQEVIEVGSHIAQSRLDPHLVDSGRGVQLWLQLERTPMDSESTRSLWQHRVHDFIYRVGREVGLRRGCRVDTSCSDLSRLARFPGSINPKTGRECRLLSGGKVLSGWQWSFADASKWTGRKNAVSQNGNGIDSIVNRKLDFNLLTTRARIFLTEGIDEPGRHSAAYAGAMSLRELGVDENSCRKFVSFGANLCRPPLSDFEANRAVTSAYRRPVWDSNGSMNQVANASNES